MVYGASRVRLVLSTVDAIPMVVDVTQNVSAAGKCCPVGTFDVKNDIWGSIKAKRLK